MLPIDSPKFKIYHPIMHHFCIFLILLTIPCAAQEQNRWTPSIDLIFTGSRASEIEPCGCHANQLGGIQYEAAVIQQFDKEPRLLLDAGSWVDALSSMRSFTAMKTRYLMLGMAKLGYDAINFGGSESTLSGFFVEQMKKEFPELAAKILSANVFQVSNPRVLVFDDAIVLTRTLGTKPIKIAITGVTATGGGMGESPRLNTAVNPKKSDFIIQPIATSLRPVVKRLQPETDLLILLVDGTGQDCVPIARAFPDLDLLIASIPDSAFNSAALPADLAKKIVISPAVKGREIGQLTLAADKNRKWGLASLPQRIPVSDKLCADPKLLQLIDDYKQATRQFQEGPKPDIKLIYIGYATCKQCHIQQYQSWEKTPHAKGLDTLTNRNQQFNPECLPCHTLAFRHENGFYSVTLPQSEGLGSVQCENCHGPARRHAQTQLHLLNNPLKKLNPSAYAVLKQEAEHNLPSRKVNPAICKLCHQPDRDKQFDFKMKVLKVKHPSGS